MSIKDIIKNVESSNWNNITQKDMLEILKTLNYLVTNIIEKVDYVKEDIPKLVQENIDKSKLIKESII